MTSCRKKAAPLPAAPAPIAVPSAAAPAVSPEPPAGDPLTRGQWWLYQLQYDKARAVFDAHIAAHPKDPSGYFYRTAVDWWQLAQDFEVRQPALEARFQKDYEATVRVAKSAVAAAHGSAKGPADLYWGGARGLWGRWQVTQGHWLDAYHAGTEGRTSLRKALKEDPRQEDAYLGLGIYDYYTATLSGVSGVLSKLVMHGDRERGLKELHRAVERGGHSRVEAMVFLIEIYTAHEHQPLKALALAEELHRDFPNSPAMHLMLVNALQAAHEWAPLETEAQNYLTLSQKQTPFYSHKGIDAGRYYAGLARLRGDHDPQGCITEMNQILAGVSGPSRWVTFAYLRRGQAYDLLSQRRSAEADYRRVKARKDVWGSRAEAEKFLHHPFTGKS